MTIGTLYEVADSAEPLFKSARSKSEWYDAMQAAGVECAPTCDCEDSLPAWEYSLAHASLGTAIERLFTGDLRADEDDTGDPRAAFHRNTSVHAIAADLKNRGPHFFRVLLSEHGHQGDDWLFERLLSFLTEAAVRRSAVVVLWEH